MEFRRVLSRSPGDMQMPRHHHSGTVIVYTITGKWKYVEHDWIAGPGSVVFETAASEHTPQALAEGGEVLALNIIVGDLVYLDADNKVIAIENWKTGMQRYLDHCKTHGITPQDLTSFSERSEEHTSELQSLMRISYAVFCLKQKK